MNYFIRSHKRRNFTLEKDGVTLFEVNFPSWAKTEATIQTAEATYYLKKRKWYSRSFTIIRNRMAIGEISSNWKGHFLFKLSATTAKEAAFVPSNLDMDNANMNWQGKEMVTYTMKNKGMFKPKLVIYKNKEPRPMLTLHTEKNWFKVNYRIDIHYPDRAILPIEELLGLFGFGAVLVRMRRAAAAS